MRFPLFIFLIMVVIICYREREVERKSKKNFIVCSLTAAVRSFLRLIYFCSLSLIDNWHLQRNLFFRSQGASLTFVCYPNCVKNWNWVNDINCTMGEWESEQKMRAECITVCMVAIKPKSIVCVKLFIIFNRHKLVLEA